MRFIIDDRQLRKAFTPLHIARKQEGSAILETIEPADYWEACSQQLRVTAPCIPFEARKPPCVDHRVTTRSEYRV